MLYFVEITSSINYSERRKLCHQNVQKILIVARNLLSKMCANIVGSLKKVIFSKEFLARHRNSPKAFTRQRKLPFHLLICFLLNFVQALSKSKHVIVLLFQRTQAKVIELIKDLHEIFVNTTEPIRPHRSFPRNHKVLKRKYYYSYKSTSTGVPSFLNRLPEPCKLMTLTLGLFPGAGQQTLCPLRSCGGKKRWLRKAV